MKIPANLKHKPVIVCENYENIDGRSAYSSEAKGLSVGLAQWNDRGNVSISAKVWRHTGEKWSRQSEELPLHRVLDLAILILETKLFFRYQGGANVQNPLIERVPLQGDAMSVALCTDNELLESDIRLFERCLSKDDELLGERMHRIAALLKKLDVIKD